MTDNRSHLSITGRQSRREFLRRSAMLAGAGVAAPYALELAGLTSALQVNALDGYKALVCVFLYGGNDHYDTVIPYDLTSYNAYATFRGPTISRPYDTLLPLAPGNGFNDGRAAAFTPQWGQLKGLFDNGKLALISNVGTLRQLITKAQYSNSALRPPQLFSHNDQQSVWQSSVPEGATTGWGGRLGDVMLDDNGSDKLFTCISASGNAVFMTGAQAFQYQINTGGVVDLNTGFSSSAPLTGLRQIMNLDGVGPIPTSYSAISKRSLAAADRMKTALAAVGEPRDANGVLLPFPNTGLGRQLKMVARLIAAGKTQLTTKRQVFFVSTGGFDNHDRLATDHPPLLSDLDACLAAFYRATVAIGAQDEVTTFTGSDFGRTLTINGDGSDHAWGAHHIVMGGSVNGKNAFGKLPLVADNGVDDVGQGRLIPTTSVDQYASTLALWMGATPTEVRTVIPNIDRFPTNDLGFMKAPLVVPPTTTPPTTPPATPPAAGPATLGTPAEATRTATRIPG
jgi:uncharacterized protein (DUF1501 family)